VAVCEQCANPGAHFVYVWEAGGTRGRFARFVLAWHVLRGRRRPLCPTCIDRMVRA